MKNILCFFTFFLFNIICSLQAIEYASYPIGKPNITGYLQVSEKHHLFYATYGNPKGRPVVILHGGPGIGCDDFYTRFFNLNDWYVIMLDQRGAMRSTPFASMEDNTTQHSVADIEALRKHMGIERWVVFGHSWGSCLALVYGQAYPESCSGFILAGTFLGREKDISFFREMGRFSRKAYEEFLTHLDEEERKDIPKACYQRIMHPDPAIHMNIARALMKYQLSDADVPPSPEIIENILSKERFVLSFMRALVHYAYHQCFLEANQILNNMEAISHLPATIVHGSLDVVCSPEQAYLLHQNWQKSILWIIEGAGHSCKEPAIMDALVRATNTFVPEDNN